MAAIPEDFWQGEEEELATILERHLLRAAQAAGLAAVTDLADVVSVDFGLVNEAVREWSKSMSLDLVKGITETSRKFSTDAIAEWIESGEPLGKLTQALEPMFGPVRAEMIGSTEVTRAYAEGNRAAWRISGVVGGRRWNTAVDELVCEVCGPLHNETALLGSPFVHPETGAEYSDPPSHPRCRCWTTPHQVKT